MLTLTSLTIWLRWEQAVGGGSGFAGSSGSNFAGSKLLVVDLVSLVAVDLASLGASCERWNWLRWEQAGSSGILTVTCLTIWLCWEQAGSGGSGFAGRGESSFAGSSGSGFAGSKLVAVDWASLGTSW